MLKIIFLLVFSCLMGNLLPAQTLITDMGAVRFFNTLDSAKSTKIMALGRRCSCLLMLMDSTHSMLLKLDLDTNKNMDDTAFYRLDYNVLSGDFAPPVDSIDRSPDSLAERPGIYIKIRDTVIRDETVLTMVDYGVHHYTELKRHKQEGEVYSSAFIHWLIALKPSLKSKRALARCK